jgi:hypothetical protein
MSSKLPSSTIAFNEVMEAYYQCRTDPTRGGGFYATLSSSVLSKCGKVQICPSDLICDVEMAANRALQDFTAERGAFRHIYLELDEAFKKEFSRSIGAENFKLMEEEIIRRVGTEFEDAGIYPIKKYRAVSDTR